MFHRKKKRSYWYSCLFETCQMYPKRDPCQHYSKNYHLSLKISLPKKTHLQGKIAIGD